MRKSLYSMMILLILFSCKTAEKEDANRVENLVEISLYLEGYNPAEHKGFIDLTIENSINPIKKQLRISDDGVVTYNFINLKKRELSFDYAQAAFSFVASPNDEIEIHVNTKELLEGSKFDQFEITGKNRVTNELIMANTYYLDSLIGTSSSPFTRNGSTPDIEYKNRRIGEMRRQLHHFQELMTVNHVDDTQFIEWATTRIKCSAGEDVSVYPYFGPINRTLFIEDDYFSFRQEVKPVMSGEIVYQDYLRYVESLSTSLLIMSNVSDRFESEREQLKRDSTSNFPILINMIKGLSGDEERELIMAYAFKNGKKIPEPYQDSLKYFVNDELAMQLEHKDQGENKPITALLEEYEIPGEEKVELLELYGDAKDRIVFHDFWFANCAPCIREMPNYNDLMASVGSDVVFIFYGAYMKEEEWKSTIEKYGLRGKHHLLTKNQLAFFEKYFGVHGFPHHHIVNTEGQIVNEQIPAVIPQNFERIEALIAKHDR